jgi:exopolysaccharide biosynthesis predicted pyruvyltransferase EpsI
LGEIEALRRLGVRRVESRHGDHVDMARRAVGEFSVLIHGGGNFGDIWPEHNRIREQAIAAHHGRPVVQLPVSLHVDRPAGMTGVRRAVDSHGNVAFMWRDSESYDQGVEYFPDSQHHLVPDAAFALQLARTAPAASDRLLIRRTDIEVSSDEVPARYRSVDWDFPPRFKLSSGWWAMRALERLGSSPVRSPRAWQVMYGRLASAQLRYALGLLSSAEVVVSDRLHGHILSTIAGIPNVLYADKNRKNISFFKTWSAGLPHVWWADSLAEALELAASPRARAG